MAHIVLTETRPRSSARPATQFKSRDTAGRVVVIFSRGLHLEEIRQAKQETGGPSITTPQLVEYLRSSGEDEQTHGELGCLAVSECLHDLPRQRRHQLSRSRNRSTRPWTASPATDLANPGRAGHKMALAAERALDDCRHLLNQFFHGEGAGAVHFHAQLHRRAQHGVQGRAEARAITSSPPIWSTTASAGRCGRWSWPARSR